MTDLSARRLAAAILVRAVRDTRRCRPRYRGSCEQCAERDTCELMVFWSGWWCEHLCDVLDLDVAYIRRKAMGRQLKCPSRRGFSRVTG